MCVHRTSLPQQCRQSPARLPPRQLHQNAAGRWRRRLRLSPLPPMSKSSVPERNLDAYRCWGLLRLPARVCTVAASCTSCPALKSKSLWPPTATAYSDRLAALMLVCVGAAGNSKTCQISHPTQHAPPQIFARDALSPPTPSPTQQPCLWRTLMSRSPAWPCGLLAVLVTSF